MEMSGIPWYRRNAASMRRFYDWINPIYGLIEWRLGPKLDRVLATVLPTMKLLPYESTAIEYACGSGLLSLKLAPFFSQLNCRDQSEGMLARARSRAKYVPVKPSFEYGDILAIDEADGSVDYVFMSFALHLFSSGQRKEILTKLGRVARKEVIIIDHGRSSDWLTEIVERLEGSHYDQFIREDFVVLAQETGYNQIHESEVDSCMVLRFQKSDE